MVSEEKKYPPVAAHATERKIDNKINGLSNDKFFHQATFETAWELLEEQQGRELSNAMDVLYLAHHGMRPSKILPYVRLHGMSEYDYAKALGFLLKNKIVGVV